ncbi:MAG TPA: sugar phosphate nucleotidyltransferase [Streptosporangiaceae bacterium]|nr:sugar phosphate nucleotidyltransferase [Streptosporangiaceae bacterium]
MAIALRERGLMLYSVILAGGSGTRFWPVSRADDPKFLHTLTGSRESLLQMTAARLSGLSSPEQTYVVTGAAHVDAVTNQLPAIPRGNILVEPVPRDSCAAIGLAVSVISARDPDSTVAIFSADHLISDHAAFVAAIRQAEKSAAGGYLMTIGVRPDRPETGFGYLKVGGVGKDATRLVSDFKEKPSHEIAQIYLESGQYLWNAGMFVFRGDVFLSELAEHKPALFNAVSLIGAEWDLPDRAVVLHDVWPHIERISVDFAVMEPAAAAGKVATVQADFGWSDIGDFNSLWESLALDDAGNLVVAESAETSLQDVKSCVVFSSSERVIAALGVDGLVIVDTSDALLICPRSRAHEVKQLVNDLRERGLSKFT